MSQVTLHVEKIKVQVRPSRRSGRRTATRTVLVERTSVVLPQEHADYYRLAKQQAELRLWCNEPEPPGWEQACYAQYGKPQSAPPPGAD
jgi:hypothetical protein